MFVEHSNTFQNSSVVLNTVWEALLQTNAFGFAEGNSIRLLQVKSLTPQLVGTREIGREGVPESLGLDWVHNKEVSILFKSPWSLQNLDHRTQDRMIRK